MQRVGIVDLGSNTARLVVFAYRPGRWFRKIDEIREPIRLGESMGRGNRLSEPAMQRAEAALNLYAKYAQVMKLPDIEVIATSAVRDAVNREAFLQRVRPLGLPIRVLSGEEEAELGVRAVANGFDFEEAWVVDVGGGSAQISQMLQRRSAAGQAYPLGAVRLTESCLESDPPSSAQVQWLEKVLQENVGQVCQSIRSDSLPLVAMGGAIRNMARAVQKSTQYPLDRLHGFYLTLQALDELSERLLAAQARRRARIAGIHPDRADIIVAAALFYRWLLRSSGREGLWISGQGVREGAFYGRFLPHPHLLTDIGDFSVRNIFEQYPQSDLHTEQVRFLARRLFEELLPLHGLGARHAFLLDAAARLHDIGMTLGYHKHHKHGAYLINSSPLNGFSHRETALLMLLVRFHRKGVPSWGSLGKLPGQEMAGRRVLLQMAACLRLAEFLERSRGGRIRDLQVKISKRKVRIRLTASENPFIEIWETKKQAYLFERAFQRRLLLEEEADDRGQIPSMLKAGAAQ